MKSMKLLTICAALLTGTVTASAMPATVFAAAAETSDAAKCGENLTWAFDAATGTVTISGEGAMDDVDYADLLPWADLRDQIKAVVFEEGVTAVGNYAFAFCENLQSVTFADSITSIHKSGFNQCTVLGNFTLPPHLTEIGSRGFAFCRELTAVTLPDGMTTIGNDAFEGCSKLTDVTIPESVTEIGGWAFYVTPWLKAKIAENPMVIVNHILIDGMYTESDVTVPADVTAIAYKAFYTAVNLGDLTVLNPDCKICMEKSTVINHCDDATGAYSYTGTIRGYEGSTAQSFAEKYGLQFAALSKDPSAPAAELTAAAALGALYPNYTYVLRDGNESTKYSFAAGQTLTVTCAEPIGGISLKLEGPSGRWTVEGNGQSREFGQQGFQHDFADVSDMGANAVTVTFAAATSVAELRVFGIGQLPADVQVWQPCHDKADIALFSTHNDDEHLFLMGLIPDAIARGKKIQVIYFANHYGEPNRMHELLNALWQVGLRNYPVMGAFPDQYSETLAAAKSNLAYAGYSYDAVVGYQVSMMRRFRPDVVVGHDVNGEYGHGQHRLNSDTVMKAVELSGNPASYPDSAEKYGAWDVPKTYIHLLNTNRLVMNYDVPLDYYGGKTAYQVSLEGYALHYSQQYTWFTQWAKGSAGAPYTKASQITSYSPCLFGLYRTTVGLDSGINDMFEHIDTPPAVPKEPIEPKLLRGDVDLSGKVDVSDAVILARYLVGDDSFAITDQGLANADADGSGKLDTEDVNSIVRLIVGLV